MGTMVDGDRRGFEVIRPARLEAGDLIGIASPAWYGGSEFDRRFWQGVRALEGLGYRVRVAPHALNNRGFVSDTAENRVDDLHDLVRDREVKAIIASIGGNHSCHLLPRLDFELIRRNPKIFMGYSDMTVLTVAMWQMAGLVTFNGPTVLAEFAEYPTPAEYTIEWMKRVLSSPEPAGVIEESPWWTEEFLDWTTGADMTRPRRQEKSLGWTWLKGGVGEGFLVGGCLESLQHLRGTRFWPDLNGAILFLETSEDKPSPASVDGILMDYENMGVWDGDLRGLLIGRPMGYTEEEKEQLRQVILERTAKYRFPIITDMDFGHTSPMFTLPVGCKARIDGEKREFEILEGAVVGTL